MGLLDSLDPALDFLNGGGEMGELIRRHEWAKSSLGTPEHWPSGLRTCLRILLNSGHPMYIWWGDELVCFYNDAYRALIGQERHPSSLGQRGQDVWAEIWDAIEPQIAHVRSGFGATWHEDQLIPITRNGRQEDVYWTYSYSPIDEAGAANGVGGVLVVCSETTERVLSARRREEEAKRQRHLFQQAPGFVVIMRGAEHVVEFVNEAHKRAFGSDDWVGKAIREAFPDIEGQGFFELLDGVYSSGEAHQAQGAQANYRYPGSGMFETRYLDFVYAPVFDADGGVEGVFCDGYDVTDRVMAQHALKESETRFRAVQDTSVDGFMVFESLRDEVGTIVDFRWIYANAAAARIVGKPAPLLLGSRLLVEMPGNREDGLFDAYIRVVESGEPWMKEFAYQHEGIDSVFRSAAAKTGDGFAVSFADLTERTRDETRLRVSEMRFRAAIDAVQGILWTNTPDGEMLGDQPGWAGLTGQSPSEYQGYGWSSALHPDDAEKTLVAWQAAVSEKQTFVFEHRVRRHDGAWRHFTVRAVPTFDADGEITEWVGVHTDVTEQRTAEVSLRDLTATLEERVALAIAERAEALARLHEAQKVETLGQLTGGVAHDFNNLLTPIMGGIDMLSRKLAHDERAQRIASGAMQSAERAKTLVQRLLSFGRRQTLQSRAVNLSRLVDGMRDLIERSIGPSVQVTIEISNDLPPVEVDPNQLELALLNLCVNARDAMSDGGKLTISAASVDSGEGDHIECVALRVTDTGQGMDEDTLARATEPFFTTKGVGQGTGLGLSMVFGLAAQSGGKLRLTSTLGEGTTAELVLPVSTSSEDLIAFDADLESPVPGAGTILLVDDEELVRMSVADGLRDLGYKVVEAASASGALERLREGLEPDILLTDHMMPGMTGAALAREARSRLPKLQILMITGYANLRPDETKGLEVLAKPFQQAALAIKVAELMHRVSNGNVVKLAGPAPLRVVSKNSDV